MRAWLLLLFSIGCFAQTCVPAEGDRLRARDLATAVPEFLGIPPETPLAYAPAPGEHRIVRAAELRRLADRFGITLAAEKDVCFELPMQTLTADKLIAAMRTVPGFHTAQIEIVDFMRNPLPKGEVHFAPQTLDTTTGSSAGALWRGYVEYAGGRKFVIWARARISVHLTRILSIEPLKTGRPIQASQVRVEEYVGSARPAQARVLAEVLGRVPTRSIPAGTVVSVNWLREPNDVSRGDTVEVEVFSGAARLTFTGKAESSGRLGDSIAIRNPQSGKTFAARVAAKGKAIVTAPGAAQ